MPTPAEPKTPNPAPAPPVQTRPVSPLFVLAIAVFGVLAGAAAVVALRSSAVTETSTAGAPRAVSTEAAPADANTTATTPVVAATAVAPKWTGGVRRSRGRDIAIYELEAGNEVQVWSKVVRPLLTVRCIAGTTEVFVYTQSAAALEGSDGRHTVRVGIDGGGDVTERWLASADYDALFAENGVAAARRLLGARTMRFGFTPFNGAPVTARFDVAGFNEIAGKLAQTCRWKN